jgi:ATP-dependent Clp protease ATP-binding subunit ClpC
MDPLVEQLLPDVRRGDIDSAARLLDHLRSAPPSVEQIVAWMQAPEHGLRWLAVHLAALRREPDPDLDILLALEERKADSDHNVRVALAVVLSECRQWPLDDTLRELATDREPSVRRAALQGMADRPGGVGLLLERLRNDVDWTLRQHAATLLARAPATPEVLRSLFQCFLSESDGDVQLAIAQAAERQFIALGGWPEELPEFRDVKIARDRLTTLRATDVRSLAGWLDHRLATDVDLDALREYGSILTLEAEAGRLPHAHGLDEQVETVLRLLRQPGSARAVVLLGDPGVGKTALIHELTHRLRHQPEGPWIVVQVPPGQFLTGTRYVGEWETKVDQLVRLAARPRRVVLYVPNLEELATVGKSASSDFNVALALAPAIERGDIVVVGESTRDAFARGLGANPSLRRLFQAVNLHPQDAAGTRNIVQTVALDMGISTTPAVVDRLIDLADFAAASSVQPGRTVGLLRLVLSKLPPGRTTLNEPDLLETVSRTTGVPIHLLDDRLKLDRGQVRQFFDARVMGQPEAVDAVVDVVTLIKAGVTDPSKPMSVLLFVGPTGVGKTELARSLAEYLFGDAARLVRLDMSEYASLDGFERLIGAGNRTGVLTSAVREQPFTVLLLDEIEKSSLAVFDLCLAIFDAGRLTDGHGRTADFRRSIIILTSNVGSRIRSQAPVGFGRAAPPLDVQETQRELSESFRPEFLNRLDRVVFFRQLSEANVEQITRRELDRVMQRTGITRRRISVEVDAGVVPLLLREGYSPLYGARHLKRTVERMVLLPIARTIAGGEAQPGALVRLVPHAGRIEVQVTTVEGPVEPAPTPVASASEQARLHTLAEEVDRLRNTAAPLSERKSLLNARALETGFYQNRAEVQAVYDEIYRIDKVLRDLDSLEASLTRLQDIGQDTMLGRVAHDLEDDLDSLESQARLLAFLVGCQNPRDLGDAYVVLTRVTQQGEPLDAVRLLARMYRELARRRSLEVEILDDRQRRDPDEDVIVLQVTGAGAYALLAGEAGLHRVGRGGRNEDRDEKGGSDREVVRVEVLRVPWEPLPPTESIRLQARDLPDHPGRLLERVTLEATLRHEPSKRQLIAWTDRSRREAAEILTPLLQAYLAAENRPEAPGMLPIIRRYTLGPDQLVRDVRTGKRTARLDLILEGHLDAYLQPPAPVISEPASDTRPSQTRQAEGR